MTAPSPTARVKPSTKPLEEGFSAKITFEADTDVDFFEVEITPGGYDIGEKIDQTTQFNQERMTSAPPALYDKADGSCLVAYNPAVITQIKALLGTETTITITYPDGSSDADFGWLKSFVEGTLVIKGRPTATVGFSFGGRDADGNEESSVYTAPPA